MAGSASVRILIAKPPRLEAFTFSKQTKGLVLTIGGSLQGVTATQGPHIPPLKASKVGSGVSNHELGPGQAWGNTSWAGLKWESYTPASGLKLAMSGGHELSPEERHFSQPQYGRTNEVCCKVHFQ